MKQPETIREARSRAVVHQSRAQDTWDNADIHAAEATPWVRGQSLAAPPARPGFAQRWIRVAMNGQEDPTNVARKMREGWKPRPSSTIPGDFQLPTISHGEWAGCLGVEGSVLMERPLKLSDRHREAIDAKTDMITRSLESELQKASRPGMEITQERRTSVGREVKVAADE